MSKDEGEWITPNYETISTVEKRQFCELMNSTLLNAFSYVRSGGPGSLRLET